MANGSNEVEIVVRATDQTKGFADSKKGAKELTAEIAKAEAELRALGKVRAKADIDADTNVVEKKIGAVEAKLEELRAKPTSPKIEADIAVAERNLGRLETQLQGLKGEAAAQINARADVAAAEARLDALKAKARELDGMTPEITPEVNTSGAESSLGGLGDRLKPGALASGAAVGGVFGAGLANNLDITAAEAKLNASFALSAEDAAKAGATASAVFSKGYTDNMGDVTAAIGAIGTSMVDLGTIGQPELEALAGKALKLSDVFGVDVANSTQAAGRLMKSGLAADGTAALDLITASFQQVGDGAEDLLDTVNEYSPFLARLGMDGESAFGSLAAAQRLGLRDTDAWGDAMKEFSLRAIDTADSTTDAYRSLGLGADRTRAAIAKGGPDAEKAMSQVVQALMKVKDPVEQNRIGVELFGTQWEDTVRDVLPAMDPLANKMGDVGGATDRMVASATTAKDRVQGLRNDFDMWTASLIETEGPIGDVAAGISAFGPMALDAAAGVGPLLMALKMNGIADAIKSGPGAAVDDLGGRLDKTGGKADGLKGKLGGLGSAVVLGGAILALGELQKASEDADYKIGDLDDGLQDLSGALTQLATGDFSGIFSDIEAEYDQMIRHLTGTNDFEFDVDTGPAKEQVVTFMNALKGNVGEVKINGQTTDATQALADVIQKINQGGGEVDINGKKVSAEDALDQIVQQINKSGGMVNVNGNMVPAGDALKGWLLEADSKVATLVIDGHTEPVNGKTTAAVEFANGQTGVIELDGDPYLVDGKTTQAVAFADGSTGTVTIDGAPDPATGKVQATVRYADGSTGRILVDARTGQAESAINHAARDRLVKITAQWYGLERQIDGRYGGGRITGATGGIMSGGMTLVGERGPELVKRHAAGGVTSSGMQWVGEQGPELVNLAPGAMVYPSGQSKQMMGGGGGGQGPIQVQLVAGPGADQGVATLIMELVRTGKLQLKGVNI